jgi:hypothetical protein
MTLQQKHRHFTVAKNTALSPNSLWIIFGLEQCIFFYIFHFGSQTFILHDFSIFSPN